MYHAISCNEILRKEVRCLNMKYEKEGPIKKEVTLETWPVHALVTLN